MLLTKGVGRMMDRLAARVRKGARHWTNDPVGSEFAAVTYRNRVHGIDFDYIHRFAEREELQAAKIQEFEIRATVWSAVCDTEGRWHGSGNQDKLLSQLTLIRLAGEL